MGNAKNITKESVAREFISRNHKKIRLPVEVYNQQNAFVYLTICTIERLHIFLNQDLAKATVDLLIDKALIYKISLFAFCLMPDHLHLLISAGERVSVIDFVQRFKSLSTKLAWNHGLTGRIWQKSFYDRFLRKDEQISETINYIFNNPVRKDLVSNWAEYPYSGSLEFEL